MNRLIPALGMFALCLAVSVARAEDPVAKAPPPQDKPAPAKAKAPAKAPPPAAKVPKAAPPPPRPVEFLGNESIRMANGMIVRFYRTNFVQPEALIPELKLWCSKKAVIEAAGPTFTAPSGGGATVAAKNILRIEETEENWPVLKRVIETVDLPMPQVNVEAKIVEILYSKDLRIGVRTSVTRPLGDTFFRSYVGDFANTLDTGEVSDFVFRQDDKYLEFEYILQLAESGATTKISSHPEILASQGQVARLHIGKKEPIVSQQLSANRVSSTTRFEDVGLKLEVTPLFIGREYIRAKIVPEVSRVSELRVTGTGDGSSTIINPVISTQRAETVVTVPDGETIVIGGLVQDQTQVERDGLPYLMDIPVVGKLFGSTTDIEQRFEVVFFITMTIVRPWETQVIVPESEELRVIDQE